MSEKHGYAFPKRIALPLALLAALLGLTAVPLAAAAKTVTKTRSTWLRGPAGRLAACR